MAREFTMAELAKAYEEHPLRQSTILARVQKQKGSLSGVTELDLAVDDETEITDQNHIGGLAFLRDLARKARVNAESIVVDAGCGLGGASRALAYLHGCRVHGVELTKQRYRDAVALTELVGLHDLVSFTHGDFLSAELPSWRFDVVLAQSSFVHFRDKQDLAARSAGLLAKGGRLAIEDVYLIRPAKTHDERRELDEGEEVWNAHISGLDEWLPPLQHFGFRVEVNEDLSETFLNYYSNLLAIFERSPAGSFSANEVTGWRRAVALSSKGILGYIRLIASRHSD